MEDVEGKTAFITGGASGRGLGMATVFAKAGMKVALADIRQEALDEAMKGFAGTNLAVHPIYDSQTTPPPLKKADQEK